MSVVPAPRAARSESCGCDSSFIIFSSNVLAILGLRAMFFLLADVMGRFHYLHIGLALVLVFIGAKMLVDEFLHVPVLVSLGWWVACASCPPSPPSFPAGRECLR